MPPWRQPFAITKYAIKLEWIKIIQFCLKIWDLCTFLHLFRLGLVCRWGVVPSQIAFFTFRPKKVHVFCSCELPGKNFHVFKLEPDRPCLDWQLMWLLTSWPIYNPFKLQPKWREKCKIWLWHQFYHRTINCRKICNTPIDALMCPLQIINWLWTSITNPSWCKQMLYPPTPPQKSENFEFDVNFFKDKQIAKEFEMCS